MASDRIKQATRHVVELLVDMRYDDLVRFTGGKRLSKEMIETAIHEYGHELRSPPESAYDSLDIVQVHNVVPAEWSIRFALWTRGEGQSDLSVELTLVETGDVCVVELDDIHVL